MSAVGREAAPPRGGVSGVSGALFLCAFLGIPLFLLLPLPLSSGSATSAAPAATSAGSFSAAQTATFAVPSLMSAVPIVTFVAPGPAFAGEAAGAVRVTVELEGVRGTLRDNVLAALAIYQRRNADLTEAEIRRMHGQAEEEIRAALEPFGHYQVSVRAELAQVEDAFVARYQVEPGPVVRIGDVDVRLDGPGADDPNFQEALAAFPLNEGDRLLHELYERGRTGFEEVAARRGYFDARWVERRVPVDLVEQSASIVLHYDTGERFRFGEVEWIQDEFREDLLDDYIPFAPGDPFHRALLMEFQGALADTDLFDFVEVDARPEEAVGTTVPVRVTLEPRQRLLYTLGLGYGTDTGTRGSAGVEFRRLNRWGHRLSTEVQASFLRRNANLRYTIPYGGAGNDFAITAGYRDDDLPTFRDRTALLRASLTSSRWGWREVLYVDLMRSRFRVGALEGVSTLVIPGVDWTRTRADNPIFTTRGHRLGLELRGSDQALGSDVSFVQSTASLKLVRPLGSASRFLTRADLGGTWVDDFLSLPGTIRYFAGGDRSIRGFGFERLGPTDEQGEPVGGRYLLTGSVEVEHLFGGTWGAAVFYDAGNAVRRFDRPVSAWLEQGAGVGARWLSPIGMVRLDLATALSESGLPLRIHFRLGPDL